jgi:hypothetical protein
LIRGGYALTIHHFFKGRAAKPQRRQGWWWEQATPAEGMSWRTFAAQRLAQAADGVL